MRLFILVLLAANCLLKVNGAGGVLFQPKLYEPLAMQVTRCFDTVLALCIWLWHGHVDPVNILTASSSALLKRPGGI